MKGGSGTDLADYSARVSSVTVDIDGVADDGEHGEADNVGTDVEGVLGGSAAMPYHAHAAARASALATIFPSLILKQNG